MADPSLPYLPCDPVVVGLPPSRRSGHWTVAGWSADPSWSANPGKTPPNARWVSISDDRVGFVVGVSADREYVQVITLQGIVWVLASYVRRLADR